MQCFIFNERQITEKFQSVLTLTTAQKDNKVIHIFCDPNLNSKNLSGNRKINLPKFQNPLARFLS